MTGSKKVDPRAVLTNQAEADLIRCLAPWYDAHDLTAAEEIEIFTNRIRAVVRQVLTCERGDRMPNKKLDELSATCDVCKVPITGENAGTSTTDTVLCRECLERVVKKMQEECQG